MRMVLAAICWLMLISSIAHSGHQLKVELSVAPAIPCVGEIVELRMMVVNKANASIPALVGSAMVSHQSAGRVWHGKVKTKIIAPKMRMRMSIAKWRPKYTGWHTFRVTFKAIENGAELRFAVTHRKVHFAWYDTPKGLRWATISTAIRKEEIDDWKWRGRIALAWKGGVCYWNPKCHPKASVEDQTRCWGKVPKGVDGIGVDEWLEREKISPKLAQVIVNFKRRNPHLLLALWNTPSEQFLNQVVNSVDIFMPEVYLNYRAMHLGHLRNAIEYARQFNLLRKTLIGLGIHHDPKKGRPLKTAPHEIDAQLRTIKQLAPNILGIAFFNFRAAPKGLPKTADELCCRYFVMPVLKVEQQHVRIHKRTIRITAIVTNIGNMTAYNGRIIAQLDGNAITSARVRKLAVGESQRIALRLRNVKRGFHILTIAADESSGISQVDDAPAVPIGIGVTMHAGEFAVALPPAPFDRSAMPMRIKLNAGSIVTEALECNPDGTVRSRYPVQMLHGGIAVWVVKRIPAGAWTFFKMTPSRTPREVSRNTAPKMFQFENRFYSAVLDVGRDAITEIAPKPSNVNLLAGAWRLSLSDTQLHVTDAHLMKGEVCTQVTVHFTGERINGWSRYTFYRESPVIEIERHLLPRNLKVHSAREGARFPQRGGAIQTWLGEGALRIGCTELHDATKYRDCYFGFGCHPASWNCDRTGWCDFVWQREFNAGLGIGILRRWVDSASRTYDVTRYYDGADWVDIFYVFDKQVTLTREQASHVILIPHGYVDLLAVRKFDGSAPFEATNAPIAGAMWTYRHAPMHVVAK